MVCTFVTPSEPVLTHYYYLKSILYSYFLNCAYCHFFLFQDPILDILHLVVSLWTPLDYDSFSEFSCLWLPCEFWGVLVKYFIGCPSVGIMALGEEDYRGKMSFSSHHITSHQGNWPSTWFITWLRLCLSGFSIVRSLLSLFHTVLFAGKSLWAVGSYS